MKKIKQPKQKTLKIPKPKKLPKGYGVKVR
jgi:hypothetical protein